MNRIVWFGVLLTALVLPRAAEAQQGTIQGTVVDANSMRPLSGAQVFIPDTGIGTLTNQAGRFILLNVPPGTQLVRTSIIGYTPFEESVQVASAFRGSTRMGWYRASSWTARR